MAEHSSMHSYLNWAKERIDEMDAALGSFETKASQVKADSKVKADQLIGDLKRRRDEFRASAKKQAESDEAAWERARADLESQWHGFEGQVKAYIETIGKQIGQQQATFHDLAAAQAKAWRQSADDLHGAAAKLAASGRGELDAAVKKMRADAAEADARLQKLKQAGSESWAAMSSALAESRKAFDQANRVAWDAFRRAAPPQA